MTELGAIIYQGPSLLTGDPIVGALSGLEGGSMNPKTGAMVQAWILRSDLAPMDAKRQNLDDAICGDCKLRGENGRDSGCYVAPWLGPYNVYKAMRRYPVVSWLELAALLEGRTVRICAYGDPAAAPFELWRIITAAAAGFVAYTHQWRRCDRRLQAICMASVDTPRERDEARCAGWRTFRIRRQGEPVAAGVEFMCPASDEMGHRTTCHKCQLCRGTSSPARHVTILAHGKPSSLRVFTSGKI